MLILSALILLCTVIGITVAYIKATADPIENTFAPAVVSCEINEAFDGEKKENVTVKNTGNVKAYIRAAVTITWQTETLTNVILATSPKENVDYKITMGDTKWNRGADGYWYYSDAVSPNDFTGALFSLVQPTSEAPAGYKLSVTVLCEAIQSDPLQAVAEAWNVSVTDSSIYPAA